MRFVRFDEERLGLLTDDGVVDLTDKFDLDSRDPLVEYIRGEYDASEYANDEPNHDLDSVRLKSPVKRPGKVIAAPLNYREHIEEAFEDSDLPVRELFSIEDKGYFLKAPSSVVGPEDGIELPFSDRRIDHEVELAFVMDGPVKDVNVEDAWDHIFGYTILLDVSVRGEQDRSNRKSYDTFTVIGPSVTVADEIDDPQNLDLRLDLNGETRQDANTSDMIYTCGDIVRYASIGATLEAGDVITTGTPSGVSQLSGGDTIYAKIEDVGEMTVSVDERDVRYEDVDIQNNANNGD